MLAVAATFPALASCGAVSALGDATTPLEVIVLQPPADLPLRQGAPRRATSSSRNRPPAARCDRPDHDPAGALQAQYLPDVRWSDPAPSCSRR
jgi:cholesterol transport system auxiliary component